MLTRFFLETRKLQPNSTHMTGETHYYERSCQEHQSPCLICRTVVGDCFDPTIVDPSCFIQRTARIRLSQEDPPAFVVSIITDSILAIQAMKQPPATSRDAYLDTIARNARNQMLRTVTITRAPEKTPALRNRSQVELTEFSSIESEVLPDFLAERKDHILVFAQEFDRPSKTDPSGSPRRSRQLSSRQTCGYRADARAPISQPEDLSRGEKRDWEKSGAIFGIVIAGGSIKMEKLTIRILKPAIRMLKLTIKSTVTKARNRMIRRVMIEPDHQT